MKLLSERLKTPETAGSEKLLHLAAAFSINDRTLVPDGTEMRQTPLIGSDSAVYGQTGGG